MTGRVGTVVAFLVLAGVAATSGLAAGRAYAGWLLAPPALPAAAPMSLDSSMGFLLRAHRQGLGLTQDSLSKLTSRTVTASRISRLERGLDSATVAQEDSLTLALWRTARARLHPDAERRFNRIVQRNLLRMPPRP